MNKLETQLIGGILTNSNEEKFRIIEVQNNGTLILKDKANKVIKSNFKAVNDYKLNLDLCYCE